MEETKKKQLWFKQKNILVHFLKLIDEQMEMTVKFKNGLLKRCQHRLNVYGHFCMCNDIGNKKIRNKWQMEKRYQTKEE